MAENHKELTVGLSVVALTIGGIITSILVSARTAIYKGSSAVGGLAKAVYNTFKKITKTLGSYLDPIVTAPGTIIGILLKYGAMGLAWLSQNLWVLALVFSWFIYDNWKRRSNK